MTSYEIIELKRLEGVAILDFDKKYQNYIFVCFCRIYNDL